MISFEADVRRKADWQCILMAAVALLSATAVRADVSAVSDAGFVSEHTLILAAPPAEAYQALTAQISRWWDARHSYSGKAENFSLDASAGGCFCETLPNGGSVMHMMVVYADPGVLLRMVGGLGPLQGMGVSGSMDFALEPNPASADGSSTLLQYRYVVHGYVPGGMEAFAGAVDQVQLGQLLRLQAYLANN